MGRKVVFFSGGVESSTILEALKNRDIILVYTMKPSQPNYDFEASKNIANFYNKELEIFEIRAKNDNAETIHQYNYFLMVILYYSLKWPDIDEFFYGLHKDDTTLTTVEGKKNLLHFYERAKLLSNNRNIVFPFSKKTKKEQYDSLPEEVKRMLHTCKAGTGFCGKCKKCLEFLQFVKNAE